jgi:hypothetical protein
MRAYLILKEKAARWNADPEIKALLAETAETGGDAPAVGNCSNELSKRLLDHKFDRQALAAKGLIRAPRSTDDGHLAGSALAEFRVHALPARRCRCWLRCTRVGGLLMLRRRIITMAFAIAALVIGAIANVQQLPKAVPKSLARCPCPRYA